ncbi:hypothetical protein F2Q69_00014854 [Brassica cretica]|uniref:Protein kinase domain-containing protein n=1 Tax=Brassica cretica TaxID=69181 RepID=A0A8S9QTP8_BRACR|nr:hypothetical protein F2Q69_00014854 [Brassica cretica]
MAYNDIVLSVRVSNHIGFLKLMGGCLEFPLPVLIAKEVATAITYLHTAFPRIIIHRDIRANNVFLDKNGTAKLTDLSLAVTLPEGKYFGIFMLVLLRGRRPDMDGPEFKYYIPDYVKDLQERGEPVEFGGDSNDIRALRCCRKRNEDRPKMTTVAKEIKLIEQASL